MPRSIRTVSVKSGRTGTAAVFEATRLAVFVWCALLALAAEAIATAPTPSPSPVAPTPSPSPVSTGDAEAIQQKLERLSAKLDVKQKDNWDRLAAISPLLGGVLVAAIGGFAT